MSFYCSCGTDEGPKFTEQAISLIENGVLTSKNKFMEKQSRNDYFSYRRELKY